MKKSIPIVIAGIIVFLFLFPAAVEGGADGEVFVINASSEEMGFPAECEQVWVAGLRGEGYSVDNYKGKAYVYGKLGRMSSMRLEDGGSSGGKMAIAAVDGGMKVDTEGGSFIFRYGEVLVGAGDVYISLQSGEGQPEVLLDGNALVVVKVGDALFEICKSGMARVSGVKKAEAKGASVRGSLRAMAFDYSGVEAKQSLKDRYGIIGNANGEDIKFGQDWLWVKAGENSGAAVLPGWGSKCRMKGNELEIEGTVYIKAVGGRGDVFAARCASHPAICVKGEGVKFVGRLEAGGRVASVEIIDRNENGRPDFDEDLWLWDSGANGSVELAIAMSKPKDEGIGMHAAVFKVGGKDLDEIVLDESGGVAGDKYKKALTSMITHEKVLNDSKAEVSDAERKFIKPAVVLEDWNDDGTPLNGSLLFGGFLSSDRFGKDSDSYSYAWDFNADGIADAYQVSVTYYQFNFMQEWVSLFNVGLDVLTGNAGLSKHGGYRLQSVASQFNKTCWPGLFYKGAAQGFEEHFFIDLDSRDYPEIFSNGANFFYYANGGGNINRLTMGRLHGYGALRAWEIELDPEPSEESINWHVKTWEDPWGHKLKLNTISVPEEWDGSRLGPSGFLRGWYAMANQEHKCSNLKAVFSPPGSQSGSSEGLYTGVLTTQERIEVDSDGGSFMLYYSPLMGGLHLLGADYGTYAIPTKTVDFWMDMHRFYHREAHKGDYRFQLWPQLGFHGREGKRLEGPVFLDYSASEKNGYFDTYLYDQDNDGYFDRTCRYDVEDEVITLSNGDYIAAWPEKLDFEEIRYLPENYDRISELYQRGFHKPPMVVNTLIGSAGVPAKIETNPFFKEVRPEFFVSLDEEWFCDVALDKAFAVEGGYDWRDFCASGLSRVGTMFVKNNLRQTVIEEWDDESLNGSDVIFIASLGRTPSREDLGRLVDWVEGGGVLILACPDDALQRVRFDAIGKVLGYRISDKRLEKLNPIHRWACMGAIGAPTSKAALHTEPGPWNDVKYFSEPMGLGLLDGFKYLSFAGYVLEDLGGGFEPMIEYEDDVIVSAADKGEGKILICTAEWWTNRYIWHHQYHQNNTQNDLLVERVIDYLSEGLDKPCVEDIEIEPYKTAFTVKGGGGKVRFARRYEPREHELADIAGTDVITMGVKADPTKVEVNGDEVELRRFSVLHEVVVGEGESRVEMHYEDIDKN